MLVRPWIEPLDIEAPAALREAVGGHPLVAQTLARRGITSLEAARAFFDPQAFPSSDPFDLPDMDKGVERIMAAIRQREPMAVWGDFDVDGQTSTTLLVSALRELGGVLTFYIPVRATESHGVNLAGLERLIAKGVKLVVTCDTGITAHEAADFARARGVDMVITDHHELAPTLPEAWAVINPHRLPDEGHPAATLPGVGVAYLLAQALYRQAGREGGAERFLDLVALGIVADVATQRGDARCYLQRGLEILRQAGRPGLKAMMEAAELDPTILTEEHIGFVLAPRLNALGRLSDANRSVEFLTTRDTSRARILARELEGLNARRKLLGDQVFQAARAQLESDSSLLDYAALVLAHPEWPAGVIGIVAGRLAERYNRPVALIAAPADQPARGSARSVEGFDITAALSTCSEILLGFGGHAQAAGFAVEAAKIPELRRALSLALSKQGGTGAPSGLPIDGYVGLNELSLELVTDLERLAPFGPGNPALTLATRGVTLKSHTTLGRSGDHLQLTVEDEQGQVQKVVWWQGGGWPLPEGRFDLAYTVRANNYRGRRELQVAWVDARQEVAPAVLVVEPVAVGAVDCRQEGDALAALRSWLAKGAVQVWREGDGMGEPVGVGREKLVPAPILAIWTAPPGAMELKAVLAKVKPTQVVLFGQDPGLDRPDAFLKRLAGLVKYALRATGGRVAPGRLAELMAHRESTVRVGLAWLAARGHITLLGEAEGDIELAAGPEGEPDVDLPEIEAQLKAMLAETAAYRAYFRRADAERVAGG